MESKVTRREFLKIFASLGIMSLAGLSVLGIGKKFIQESPLKDAEATPVEECGPPELSGSWKLSTNIEGVVGMHIAVLHTGKVLLFSYSEGGLTPSFEPEIGNVASMAVKAVNPDACKAALWDPNSETASDLPINRALFCAGHSFTHTGELFIVGGQFGINLLQAELFRLLTTPTVPPLPGIPPYKYVGSGATKDIHRFLPEGGYVARSGISEDGSGDGTTSLRVKPDMDEGRWYPSVVTLADGRVLAISGTNGAIGAIDGLQNTMQIFSENGVDRGPVMDLPINIFHWYPFLHVLPSGKLFVHSRKLTYLYDPILDTWDSTSVGPTKFRYSRTHKAPGTSILLPLRPTTSDTESSTLSSTVLPRYPNGSILILGGAQGEGPHFPTGGVGSVENLGRDTPATNTAEILDFDVDISHIVSGVGKAEKYAWRNTREPMHNRRVLPNAVILPDGKVLVLQGGSKGCSGGFGVNFAIGMAPEFFGYDMGASEPVYEPELFDPIKETWTRMCSMKLYRLYHGAAALLPDGRVLSAGHDGLLNLPPFRRSQYELEIFSPPYLFNGPRPEFYPDSAPYPNPVGYNKPITINVKGDASEISKVVIIRGSSVTHSLNTDQRLIELPIIKPPLGDTLPGEPKIRPDFKLDIPLAGDRHELSVLSPPNGGVAPPGFYMLFLLNHLDVPSIAEWIQIPGPASKV